MESTRLAKVLHELQAMGLTVTPDGPDSLRIDTYRFRGEDVVSEDHPHSPSTENGVHPAIVAVTVKHLCDLCWNAEAIADAPTEVWISEL